MESMGECGVCYGWGCVSLQGWTGMDGMDGIEIMEWMGL